jgi:ribose-phosphate pyrophosphokinase
MIIGLSNSKKLARNIAKKAKLPYSELETKFFPDGEIKVRFQKPIKNKKIFLVQSLQPNPNQAMLEAIFAIYTAKDLKAEKVTLIAPYLAYMRQDKRFNPGEAISQRIMAKLLSCADEIITIDPHLHRINSLKEIFKIKTKTLSANKLLAEYINKHFKNEIIIGPDIESYQWAKTIANYIKKPAAILRKQRFTAERVKIKFHKKIDIKGKNIVIVDDIISTGHTMTEAAKLAKKQGAKNIYAVCVHGLFTEGLKELKKHFKEIISTNTIENKTSKIDISDLIAENIK